MHYKLLLVFLLCTIATTHGMEIDTEISTKNKEVYDFCKQQYNHANTIIPHTQRDLASLYTYSVTQNNTDFLLWILIIRKSSFSDSCMQEAYKHSSTPAMKLFFANYATAETKRKQAKYNKQTSIENNRKRDAHTIQSTKKDEEIYNIFKEQYAAAKKTIPSITFTNPDISHNQHSLTSLFEYGIEQDDVEFIEWVLLIRKPLFEDPCLQSYNKSQNPEMRFILQNYIAIEQAKIESENNKFIKKQTTEIIVDDEACRCIIS